MGLVVVSSRAAAAVGIAAALLVSSCTSEPTEDAVRSERAAPSPPDEPRMQGDRSSTAAFVPPPEARIPRRPGRLLRRLTLTTRAARRSADRWRDTATRRDRPPRRLTLQALYQQRLLRALAADRELAGAVVARASPHYARLVRVNLAARRSLATLAQPLRDVDGYAVGRPEPPLVLLRHYRAAQRRFGVAWEVLAAVNLVESSFGRARERSHAGAQGPMQFLPSTWAAYGLGGDINDPRDAILGAANYLAASGAPRDYGAALYAYNPSQLYVRAVTSYARQMEREPRDYFVYHSWQLYVLTTAGPVRLTGPGA
jgi:soluble lytic murein transglycosylase-like protein